MTDSDHKAFAKRSILGHLAAKGETVEDYFLHRVPYEHPEISKDIVEKAIGEPVRKKQVKVSRWEAHSFERINFLVIA